MGLVSSATFAVRNANKCVKQGDSIRGAVAVCQSVGSVDTISSAQSVFSGIADGAGKILSKADRAVDSIFAKIGGESGTKILDNMKQTTGANTKLGAVAQKAVNPLLCVAAGARVLKDEDQYAALIEETAAMGAMFGTEALMKYARSAATGGTQATTGLAGKVAKALNGSKSVKSLASKAGEWFTKLGQGANGSKKQFLVKAGIDALFVCGSVLAYNLGHKIGEALSHRNKEEKTPT